MPLFFFLKSTTTTLSGKGPDVAKANHEMTKTHNPTRSQCLGKNGISRLINSSTPFALLALEENLYALCFAAAKDA